MIGANHSAADTVFPSQIRKASSCIPVDIGVRDEHPEPRRPEKTSSKAQASGSLLVSNNLAIQDPLAGASSW